MKILQGGVIPVRKPTIYDFDYTCPRCGAVLRLEEGDTVMTERSLDGKTFFGCGFCKGEIAIWWDGQAGAFKVWQ